MIISINIIKSKIVFPSLFIADHWFLISISKSNPLMQEMCEQIYSVGLTDFILRTQINMQGFPPPPLKKE